MTSIHDTQRNRGARGRLSGGLRQHGRAGEPSVAAGPRLGRPAGSHRVADRSATPRCTECGHDTVRHEGSAEDEFAASHGGAGYALCTEIIRTGESADLCGCRAIIGSARAARRALWPLERPAIATIPAPGPPLTSVRLVSSEVTTTDPINGQPDFEHVEITYVPDRLLVESKSLKDYWRWWRTQGASIERLATLVAIDVAEATRAFRVDVTVTEAPRGGISIVAAASIDRDDLDSTPR